MVNNLCVRHFSKYQKNQIVFYGDIFGFSSCMKDIARNNNYEHLSHSSKNHMFINIDNIYAAQVYKIDEINRATGVNFIWLSDSFAFASDASNWGILKSRLLDFICLLWASNFIFSGAFSFGDLHNDKNIMGETFIRAVELQQDCHSPEIVIDKFFFDKIILDKQQIYKNDDSKICYDYVYDIIQESISRNKSFSMLECLFDLCSAEISKSNEENIRLKYKCMIKMVITAIEKIQSPSYSLLKIKEKFQKIH